jgi:hypothetical protein
MNQFRKTSECRLIFSARLVYIHVCCITSIDRIRIHAWIEEGAMYKLEHNKSVYTWTCQANKLKPRVHAIICACLVKGSLVRSPVQVLPQGWVAWVRSIWIDHHLLWHYAQSKQVIINRVNYTLSFVIDEGTKQTNNIAQNEKKSMDQIPKDFHRSCTT